MRSRLETQAPEMQFLQETYPVPRTLAIRRRYTASTRETRKHQQDANAKECKTGKTIPGISRLLSEICTEICRHFQDINKAHTQE